MTVFDVANYFLRLVDAASGSVMTHLKLQKLCFYAQAWHTVFTGNMLFSQRFEAWAHGPVCPELYQQYKSFGYQPIEILDDLQLPDFTTEQLDTLNEVWRVYGCYDAQYLENLTHNEKPWIDARGYCSLGDKCETEITVDAMREYYSTLLE